MSTTPLKPSNPRSSGPRPYDKKGNPQGFGFGRKDPGAGCWPQVDRQVNGDPRRKRVERV